LVSVAHNPHPPDTHPFDIFGITTLHHIKMSGVPRNLTPHFIALQVQSPAVDPSGGCSMHGLSRNHRKHLLTHPGT